MKKIHGSFIPRKDGEVVRWGKNYFLKIATIGPQLGVTQDDITKHQDAAQAVIDTFNKVTQKVKERKEAVAAKKLLRKNQLKFLSVQAKILKLNPLFTENMGEELGIMPTTISVMRDTLTPSVKPVVFPEYVEVNFNKRGQLAVGIFCCLKGTDNWVLLDKAAKTPFIDTRPLADPGKPEYRQYMARCWDGQSFIGQDSAIKTVVFGG